MRSPNAVPDVRQSTPTAALMPGPALAVIGAVLATGLVVGLASQRRRSAVDVPARRRASWRAYLIDHLSGSDVAVAVVSKLTQSHAGTPEGDVCAWLLPQLEAEREVVRSLLAGTGTGVAISPKRIAGYASGAGAQALAGGRRGELSLFRTFESLAIGVQGKRLLWRAASERLPLDAHDARTQFQLLESAAVERWERIDACRLGLVRPTFGTPRARVAENASQPR